MPEEAAGSGFKRAWLQGLGLGFRVQVQGLGVGFRVQGLGLGG